MVNRGKPRTFTPIEAKRIMLEALGKGASVAEACRLADKSKATYESYRKLDKDFAGKIDLMRNMRNRAVAVDRSAVVGGFEEFRAKYLHSKSFTHQLQWIDVLEGRQPRDLHPSMTYEVGRPNRLLINTPPNHAKSTTITMDYVTYRICKDPNVRIIVVSKTQAQAKKFLYGIKQRLTHPAYIDLQMAFAPSDGFKDSAEMWTATYFYLGADSRDDGSQKDPTVEALGMGGQIYGARADLIILDDCVTLSNAHEWDKQMDWIRQEVASRLGPPGKLLVVGTRVAPVDLYRELRNPDHYTSGKVPWTYFAQPAILESAEDIEDWVTLWPKSDRAFEGAEDDPQDENGLYPRWTGPRLDDIRNDLGAAKWSMVYMQADVQEDAIFPAVCVRGSVNGMRKIGVLDGALRNHPANGMEGKYVIASLDPAMTGDSFALVMAADRATKKRFVLDAHRMQNPTPTKIRDLIKTWTDLYKPSEWRIEKNAFQIFLTQDPAIREFLATRGIVLREHYTGKNKYDVDFGVASMAPLFGSSSRETNGERHNGDNLIELPCSNHEGVKSLIEQLVTWAPGTKNVADGVMALWFAEIRAREIVNAGTAYGQSHLRSSFTTRGSRRRQSVINLDEWQQERLNEQGVVA